MSEPRWYQVQLRAPLVKNRSNTWKRNSNLRRCDKTRLTNWIKVKTASLNTVQTSDRTSDDWEISRLPNRHRTTTSGTRFISANRNVVKFDRTFALSEWESVDKTEQASLPNTEPKLARQLKLRSTLTEHLHCEVPSHQLGQVSAQNAKWSHHTCLTHIYKSTSPLPLTMRGLNIEISQKSQISRLNIWKRSTFSEPNCGQHWPTFSLLIPNHRWSNGT